MQDQQFNLMALTTAAGIVAERYEYTLYGVRQVFRPAGLDIAQLLQRDFNNDGIVDAADKAILDANLPTASDATRWMGDTNNDGDVDQYDESRIDDAIDMCAGNLDPRANAPASGSATVPYSGAKLSTIAFQGLRLDETTGLIDNRARIYDPLLQRFLQEDPLGYPDGMNTFTPYHVSGGDVDPSGEVSHGNHHAYPLHLGGHNDQPLFPLDANSHQAAHRYLRQNGFAVGDAGRANWARLTLRQQRDHIRASLRAAGVPDRLINQNMSKIFQGSQPGTLVRRAAPRGGIVQGGGQAGGFATRGTMVTMASGAIVLSAATYGYQVYLNAANELGEAASNLDLCRQLQRADRDAILIGAGGLQAGLKSFIYISDDGVIYNVNIRNHQGCCYFIATYRRERVVRNWKISIFGVKTNETLEPLHPTRGYACPANGRQINNGGGPNSCDPI